jgi:hypothetical protein
MFERDWQRATGKEKFTAMMSRENKGSRAGREEKAALREVRLRPYCVGHSCSFSLLQPKHTRGACNLALHCPLGQGQQDAPLCVPWRATLLHMPGLATQWR